MSYYPEDNTMDVMVGDMLQRRTVAQYERRPLPHITGGAYFATMYWPEISENEQCEWTIGSDVPRIITLRPKQPEPKPEGVCGDGLP